MKNLFYILILVFSSTLCHSIKEQEQSEGIKFILLYFNFSIFINFMSFN